MSGEERFETFFPPPPAELKRWRRRVGIFFAAIPGFFGLVLVGALGLVDGIQHGFAFGRNLDFVLPISIGVAIALPLLAFLLPRLIVWVAKRGLATVPELVLLEPGERIEVATFGAFLDRAYQAGFLVVTDRRILRVHGTFGGSRQATLALRAEVAACELTERRALRRALFRAILKFNEVDAGLTLTTKDARRFFVTMDRIILEPLLEWLRKAGFEAGFRNDEDLAQRPALTPPTFDARVIPRRKRRNVRNLVLMIVSWILVVGGLLSFAAYMDWKRSKLPYLPTLSLGRSQVRTGGALVDTTESNVPPSGTERVVKTFVKEGKWGPRITATERFELVRIGDQAILRRVPTDRYTDRQGKVQLLPFVSYDWEPIGSPGDSDETLVAEAEARFHFLEQAVVDMGTLGGLPTLTRTRKLVATDGGPEAEAPGSEIPPAGEERVVCRIHVKQQPSANMTTNKTFDLVRVGSAAILRERDVPNYATDDQGRKTVTHTTEWEPLEADTDDEALLRRATERLRSLAAIAPPSSITPAMQKLFGR